MYTVKAKYPDTDSVVDHGTWSTMQMAEDMVEAGYRTMDRIYPEGNYRIWIEIESPRDRAKRLDREMDVNHV